MEKQSLENWISEQHTRGRSAFRVRIGATAKKLATVGLIAFKSAEDQWHPTTIRDDYSTTYVVTTEEATEAVESLASAAGWPDDEPSLRVHAYDISAEGKRRDAGSWQQMGTPAGAPATSGDAMAILANALERMASANIRQLDKVTDVVGVLGDTLKHREDVNKELLESMIGARMDAVDSEASSVHSMLETLQIQLEDADVSEADGSAALQTRALDMLSNFLGMGGGGPDVGDMLKDEDFVDNVMNHPDAEDALFRAMARKAAAEEKGQGGADVVDQ